MAYQDELAEIEKKLAELKAARTKRDEAELREKVRPLMLERLELGESVQLVRVPLAPPNMPGHIVLRAPEAALVKKVDLVMWRDKKSLDDIEAKTRAAPELARACVVYPSLPEYDALVEKFHAVGTECGEVAYKLAKAGLEAEVKG